MKSLMLSQPRTSVWFGAAKAGDGIMYLLRYIPGLLSQYYPAFPPFSEIPQGPASFLRRRLVQTVTGAARCIT